MKHRQPRSIAVTAQWKPALGRIGAFILLGAAAGLLFAARFQAGISHSVRMTIADTVAPVIEVLAKPVESVSNATRWMQDMAHLREDNLRLKADNARLMQWQTVATELGSENSKLRALLKVAPSGEISYNTAHIAVSITNPYMRSAILMSGSSGNIRDNMAVMSDNGLVGRILEVGKRTSRVLLLTDVNSRIPVISAVSRERAIAGGTGGDSLSLFYLPENSSIKLGEKIVTSGDGSVLPPGLPVGIVTKIEKNTATVQPLVDWRHMEYVSVIDYAM